MNLERRTSRGWSAAAIAALAVLMPLVEAVAQEAGPLLPHVGGRIATAFSNTYGADSESELIFTEVTASIQSVQYASTRGLRTFRDIRRQDIESSSVYVLGYSDSMPRVLPGTTSLGVSAATLEELRTTGRARLSLIYDAAGSRIDGDLTLVDKDVRLPLLIENEIVPTPAIRASGTFGAPPRQATGEFHILNNKNNPMMLQSYLKLSWEKQPRLERVTRVSAGASMQNAMQQSLATLRKYDIHGILFDFGSARLRPEAGSLIADIATTLKANPTWTLLVNGHTDSIGDTVTNKRLSADRAASVKTELVRRGIDAARLKTDGLGETAPKADNATLEGRALNRRVELVRTDM